jgi:hypothetical protein
MPKIICIDLQLGNYATQANFAIYSKDTVRCGEGGVN